MSCIYMPKGFLSTHSDEDAAKRRKELREKLLKGEEVKVTPVGHVMGVNERDSDGNRDNANAIVVPEGKLAIFHWYERDINLLRFEKKAMAQYFPNFKMEKLSDGRLCWVGELKTDLRKGGRWFLQAIYDNNHPHNNSYGGSIKVYSIDPDLEEIQEDLEQDIPHVLYDAGNNLYLCTARAKDVASGKDMVTSAASSLAWAAKWIAAFELWMAGDLSTSDFSGHEI